MISKREFAFVALFTLLTLLSMKLNFSAIVGSESASFTFFQFLGPIAGGFMGVMGVGVVLFAQLFNFVLFGTKGTITSILFIIPMLGAALYFGFSRKEGLLSKLSLAVPLIAMLAFWATPAGAEAWFYALFWLVPVASIFFREHLILRSLGATFTSHAIGSAIWAWSFPMTAAQWTALVPVTAMERIIFAAGIAVSYVVFTNILRAVDSAFDIGKFVDIDRRYVVPSFFRPKEE